MKKSFLLLLVVVANVLFFSCNNKTEKVQQTTPENNEYVSGNLPSSVQVSTNVADIKGLACIVIDDYDFNAMVKTMENTPLAAACSEVRKGNFVTRNLDWFQYDQATYLMAVGHTDKHFASLTVCSLNDKFTHDFDCSNISKEDANSFMACATDGMNENGVYIGVNVVPFGQMTTKEGKGEVNYRPKEGENKDKKQLPTSFVIRLVLDHAKNLSDAERIIRETPWKDTPLLTAGGFQAHWMVATSEGTFVCEFVDGEPTFTYAESTTSPDYGNIMTNFSNYLMANGGEIQSHGAGYERFNVLKANYETATPEDFARLVFYSRMYAENYTAPNYFWTEWATDHYPAAQLMTWRDDASTRTGKLWDEFVSSYNDACEKYDWRKIGYDLDRSRGSWYTSHSSVWDLANKTLLLDIEEQNAFKAKFSLDGKFETK